MVLRRPSGFIEPCQPSKVARPPSGPLWVHEIKHDGYRLMVRRDGARVRCFTRNGHDWADRFPAIVDAAHRIKASSFLIDGEAVKFTNEHQRSQTGPRDRIASHAANTGGRRAWPRVRLPTAIGIPRFRPEMNEAANEGGLSPGTCAVQLPPFLVRHRLLSIAPSRAGFCLAPHAKPKLGFCR